MADPKSQLKPCDAGALLAITAADAVQAWPEAVPDVAQSAQIARSVTDSGQIAAIVAPDSPAALAQVMTHAYQNYWRVLIAGGCSKLDWGGQVHQPNLVLSTARLNRLVDHAVGDLTVTAEAGMRFADLQTILAKENQTLAFDPTYPDQATLGGIISTGDTGSLRQRYNGVRDMLLGISFVRSDGQIAKAGGRVVKNVAGYDLMKLFTGAYGTLGILTQVTLRVYPLPEASQTIVLSGKVGGINQVLRTLLGSALTPLAVDLVAGDRLVDLSVPAGISLAIRFQTIAASVAGQTARMEAVAKSLGLSVVHFTADAETRLWQRLREEIAEAARDRWITCKIGVKPTEAVTLLQQMGELLDIPWCAQIYAASGLGLLALDLSVEPAMVQKIRDLVTANSGFLSILQAPAALKQSLDIWGYTGNALELMQKLKYQFDPENLLNPQRFVGGI